MSWIKRIRALPSDPASGDFLKVEYVDVNLNNSRKLIHNVSRVAASSEEYTAELETTIESLLGLKSAAHELAWLDELKGELD